MTPLDGSESVAPNKQAPAPKHPPHSIEAEQSVLGGLLLNNRAWFDLSDRIAKEDFYTQDHRVIFSAISDMVGSGKPCDFVTLSEYLRQRKALEEAGGVSYLGTLAADTPSAANVLAYAEIVRERALLRALIATGRDIAELGYHPDGRPSEELLEQAEQALFEQRNRGARGANQAEGYDTLIDRVERSIETARDGGKLPGLQTGFSDFDRRTKGLYPGDLVVVGARPGMGKTSFAMNIGENIAVDQGLPVVVFSMEMSREQLAMRSIASRARVPLERLKGADLDHLHWAEIASWGGRLRAAPLYIDDTGALNPTELRARARRYKAKYGLSLVIVDYIQLMQIRGERSRENEVGTVSRALKALAKELEVPIIVLSQLSRKCEEREDKRPRTWDLRESGSIEQDADIIALLYRDEHYNKQSPDLGIAELDIAKQRNGPTGSIDLTHLGDFCRFDNYAGPTRAERRQQRQADEPAAEKKSGWKKRKPAAAPPLQGAEWD